jgi:hypothetical protein
LFGAIRAGASPAPTGYTKHPHDAQMTLSIHASFSFLKNESYLAQYNDFKYSKSEQ